MILKRIETKTRVFVLALASIWIFSYAFSIINLTYGTAIDCPIEYSTENYIGVRYKALLAEDELSETGWVLLFGGSMVTKNGEYQPHFIQMMIKAGWADLYDDGLWASGFPPKRETRSNFTVHFQLDDYGNHKDIAAWTEDPQLLPRYFTNIDSTDPSAPDMIAAEYQIDKGGYLEGREIEVSLVRGDLTRLPRDKNYFIDPDAGGKQFSQADILFREWIATLKVPSLEVNSTVLFYVNANEGDKICGSNCLNFIWENYDRPFVESDRFRVIIFDPQVKTLSGEWNNVKKFQVDYRSPLAHLPMTTSGELLLGFRSTYYQGMPALEASFGYGPKGYVKDGDLTAHELTVATRAVINLEESYPQILKLGTTMRLTVEPSSLEKGNSTTITARLTDENGVALANKEIFFDIETTLIGISSTDSSGNATIAYTVRGEVGAYEIKASYHGSAEYDPSNATTSLIIIPEFSSWIILPIFMIATLLAVVYKRYYGKTKDSARAILSPNQTSVKA